MTEPIRATLCELADRYRESAPFAAVEETAFEGFPAAARADDLRWRDAEWMVRWYYRRHLSSRYNDRRSAVESAFRENEWPTVRTAIEAAVETAAAAERIGELTPLSGVDTGVASAILYFTSPTRDIVMAEPEWTRLESYDRLDRPYPASPSPTDYREFRRTCGEVAADLEVDLVTLQRALWQQYIETEQLWDEG